MLEVKHLRVRFYDNPQQNEAVHDISFHMKHGEILGLVGESGSGKTVTAMAISGLMQRRQTICSGEIWFDGKDLLKCSRQDLRLLQGRDIGVVFQEPMTSMNPVMRIGPQVEECLKIHTQISREERRQRALQALADVELPEPEVVYKKYPHELSGGMLQRAMIASAIVSRPKLLICDEPTTALDVTIQAQILDLLKKINREHNVAILFISHNLQVVHKLCSRVAVMYQGELVEEGSCEQVFFHPQQDYTKRLIAAIPTRRKRA